MTSLPARGAERLSASARRLVGALRRDDRGLALIEFTMSIPVLLTIGLVGLEVANYAVAHLKVSNVAMIAADGASRVRDSIDEGDLTELNVGAMTAGESLEFKKYGRVILSSLEQHPTDNSKQWIRWQRCFGDKNVKSSYGKPLNEQGTAIVNGTEAFNSNGTTSSKPSSHLKSTMTSMGPAGNQIAAQGGTAVIVAEVVYTYQPLISDDLIGEQEIRYTSAFNVRQRTDQVLYNRGKIAPAACG